MNGFIGGYGMQPNIGIMPGAADQKNYCQTLTVEQANALRKHIDEFTLNISEKDKWAAWCMHRDPATGATTIMPDKVGGTVTCSICGKTWRIVDNLAKQDVIQAVNNIIDIIQTSKSLYLDMPPEAARSFFLIIALLEKIPGLYEVASKNFSDHENVFRNIGFANDPSSVGAWRTLNGGGFGGGFYMRSPYYTPMGAPGYSYAPQPGMAPAGNPFFAGQAPAPGMAQQAPPVQPMMGVPLQPGPVIYDPNAVQMGYQPAMQGFAYTPNGATQAATVAAPVPAAPEAAPTAPVAAPDGTVQVNTSFQV